MSAPPLSPTVELLRRAALRALRAPSVHNTQPWRFVLTDDALEIHADRSRQLSVLDPRRRQLLISCGCALFHARVAIAAGGHEPLVHRLPDPERPDLVARVQVGREKHAPGSTALDVAIDHRRTNRRAFADEPVPRWLIAELEVAARADGAVLFPVVLPRHRAAVVELSALADRVERADPAYLAEVRAWTTDDPRSPDGVQAAGVPYVPQVAPDERDPLPIRGFDVRGMGWLPTSSASGANQCLLLVCAPEDTPRGWVLAGEALEHVWLKLTTYGFWASPLTQVIEVRATHEQLRTELRLDVVPQVLLRVGRAPDTVATPRRPADEVIVDVSEHPHDRHGEAG